MYAGCDDDDDNNVWLRWLAFRLSSVATTRDVDALNVHGVSETFIEEKITMLYLRKIMYPTKGQSSTLIE